VLLNHVELKNLSRDEEEAITDLKCMLREIAKVKKKNKSALVLTPQ